MINKPKFWDKKISLISIILLPLATLFFFLLFLKKKLYNAKKFNIPIICVGNIYVGGTGKTPTSILLAKELTKLKKKPVILRKYYKNHIDEYRLIKSKFKNLILGKNRTLALNKLNKSSFDIAILDDGLQDYKIKKDVNIVCFNANQLIGNGLVLPSGPLRENLSTLKNVDIVVINGKKVKSFEKKILKINKNLNIFYSSYEPVNLEQFRNKRLLAVAGIGNPENFFKLIENNNLKIDKKLVYPDHHKFSKKEVQSIIKEAKRKDCQIIMTEKDYFKIKDYKEDSIKYLKVSLKIVSLKKLLNKIKQIYDKNN
tara:strand:+ start:3910 stop:4848 length:939 start_codon:yes stop_codon:yes gene_type:complete